MTNSEAPDDQLRSSTQRSRDRTNQLSMFSQPMDFSHLSENMESLVGAVSAALGGAFSFPSQNPVCNVTHMFEFSFERFEIYSSLLLSISVTLLCPCLDARTKIFQTGQNKITVAVWDSWADLWGLRHTHFQLTSPFALSKPTFSGKKIAWKILVVSLSFSL